jgi:putative peptidoglycan lipid II flippase
MGELDRHTDAATRMGVATLASRGIGFARVWAIAAVLGTTYLGNTFQASNSVSNVLFELVAAGALSAVLVPTFVHHLEAGDEREAERLASGVLGLALTVMAVVAVIGVVFAPAIARLLSTGASSPQIESQQIALSTFFLRFFVPQVLLYAVGTVATAVLFAKRRFVITALAPIANTVVLVITLVVFRILHGTPPTLDLTLTEKLVLALGGTLGVLGFVGVPTVAVLRSGFRLRPSLGSLDPGLRRLLWLSAWVALQPDVAVLLLAAIVMGNQTAGGVVAYQFAFVAFLAPYAILALPVHTTILPELSLDARRGDMAALAGRVRWALDGMAVLLLPVAAAYLALAEPAMRAITFGAAKGGVDLLAAALASLGVGLFTYGCFLSLARAFYALGDSRTPAIVAAGAALLGAGVMVAGSLTFRSGAARVAALGAGHSIAYFVGALVLGGILRRKLGQPLFPRAFPRALALSAVLGCAGWAVERVIDPSGRIATVAVLTAIVGAGAALYLTAVRFMPSTTWRRDQVLERVEQDLAFEPVDPDLAVEP